MLLYGFFIVIAVSQVLSDSRNASSEETNDTEAVGGLQNSSNSEIMGETTSLPSTAPDDAEASDNSTALTSIASFGAKVFLHMISPVGTILKMILTPVLMLVNIILRIVVVLLDVVLVGLITILMPLLSILGLGVLVDPLIDLISMIDAIVEQLICFLSKLSMIPQCS